MSANCCQLEACKIDKQKNMMQNLDRIVMGKKQKLRTTHDPDVVPISKKQLKKRARRLPTKNFSDTVDVHSNDINSDNEDDVRKQVQQEIVSMSIPVSLPDKAVCIQIHTADFVWRKNDADATCTWDFDVSLRETLLYQVFQHFWELGYFITSGGKFGGDFLIYPGDPARYHSHYIAFCVEHDKPLSVLQIVALGRLGTGVKKTVLLCSIDSSGNVNCKSLQWTGIS